jgi:hypothetical protein
MARHLVLLLALASCAEPEEAVDPNANADGDCMTDIAEGNAGTLPDEADSDFDGLDDCAELNLGTDPMAEDSDQDGLTDGEEADCFSDPTDGAVVCSDCGWKYGDPGDLESTGGDEGDIIADVELVTSCDEPVSLWDAYGEYHILFVTAAW